MDGRESEALGLWKLNSTSGSMHEVGREKGTYPAFESGQQHVGGIETVNEVGRESSGLLVRVDLKPT